jgi:hypothetical protein
MTDYNMELEANAPQFGPKFTSAQDNLSECHAGWTRAQVLTLRLSQVEECIWSNRVRDRYTWKRAIKPVGTLRCGQKLRAPLRNCDEAVSWKLLEAQNWQCEGQLEFEREAWDAPNCRSAKSVNKGCCAPNPVALEERTNDGIRSVVAGSGPHNQAQGRDNVQKRLSKTRWAAFTLMSGTTSTADKAVHVGPCWMRREAEMGQVRVPANIVLKITTC